MKQRLNARLRTMGLFFKHHHRLYLLGAALPIIMVYSLGFFLHPQQGGAGDFDFFTSFYSAFRRTIIEYHQFPWWNPWQAGGVPLYADPQFGLISLQTLFVLVFDAVVGLKLAMLAYVLISFYGLRKLFKDVIGTPEATATLLSLTWSLSWFWAFRAGGHLTFFLMAFLPWLLLYYFERYRYTRAWLWFGLILAACINGAPHNITVMSCFVLLLIALAELTYYGVKKRRQFSQRAVQMVVFYSRALLVATALSLHKLYFAFSYTDEMRIMRSGNPEEFPGWTTLYQSLWGLVPTNTTLASGWASMEAYAGIGLGSLVALGLVLAGVIYSVRNGKPIMPSLIRARYGLLFVSLALLCCLLAMGDFAGWSPYSILRTLPIFEDTRVATRWLIYTGFFFICAIACYRSPFLRRPINIALAVGLLPLAAVHVTTLQVANPYPATGSLRSFDGNQPPLQSRAWQLPRQPLKDYDDNLTMAVENHVGQLATSLNPFYNTEQGPTARCDESKIGCDFVTSGNATVSSWSPNEIILQRNKGDTDPVILNMNPGSYWLVNERYVFAELLPAEPARQFVITDSAQEIRLEYAPISSLEWLKYRLR